MGKKGRRTRWRTLSITDEHSDSEESNTTTSGVPKGYPQKSFYSRFTYSSQSTPTKRYQCDGTKSTRSSSTASENKITFNEDEYTRITTPRQDVLFKKGYLNKPKTYQTQTSTGNSTTSTGNSTGNGTPDHQSTDLEYESQFVFPNGFVDQNGIYYVNSFEPFPVMVYNPPAYYPEYNSVKTKRCSTGSLTESTSPNNEEASQDLSQSETPSNVSELNPVYNVIYPGYYYNGVCQPQDAVCEPEPRRVKKRRRRKLSRSKQEGSTSESSEEILTDQEETKTENPTTPIPQEEEPKEEPKEKEEEEAKPVIDTETVTPSEEVEENIKTENEEENAQKEEIDDDIKSKTKYDLKPDAEEFVPRAFRHSETIPMEANVQFIKIPSNFVPVPILNPMGEFNAFIPPGIPINFIPQNYVNFIPYKHPDVHHMEEKEEENKEEVKETVEVPKKNHIDIAKIVSKLEEAAKEQEDESNKTVKEEPPKNMKKKKYQKVDLKKSEEKKVWNKTPQSSPKREEPKPMRNYSDTLKKSMVAPSCERYERNAENTKMNKLPSKENVVRNFRRPEKIAPNIPNEWISVSRKKKKYKNMEESNESFEEKIEKEGIVESIEVIPEASSTTLALISEQVVNETKPEEIKEVVEEKKTKKKSKKNHAKTLPLVITKRVMITDLDLTLEIKNEIEEVKIEPTKIEEETRHVEEDLSVKETKNDEVVEEAKYVAVNVDMDKIEDEIVLAEMAVDDEKTAKEEKHFQDEKIVEEKKELPEKKLKKKKKKHMSKPILSNQSSSNTTLNVNDDSYDFLLDESLEKTNVEVSQELDKMIQRGMYSSLEEKIKSMNIESNDTFFKTIISNISSRESSVEENHPYIKSSNLSRLITNPTTLIYNKPISTHQIQKSDDFLSEPTTPDASVKGGAERNCTQHNDELYPITRAVKEWMTKTRETTPDVEILKSPSTILKEFGLEGANSNDEVTVFSHEEKRKTSTSSIEEGEDVLEAYESKYGKNEDFVKIREEVEELKNNYPKHGNLPYRAICCSIM